MRVFSFCSVLALAVASAVLTLPFFFGKDDGHDYYHLDLVAHSDTDAVMQLYYDDGTGLREQASVRVKLSPGTTSYRFPIPPGTYRAFRFDPMDHAGSVEISDIAIRSGSGVIVRRIAPTEFTAANQIQSLTVRDSALRITTTAGADDPQLSIPLSQPLDLTLRFADGPVPKWAICSVVVVAVGLALLWLSGAPAVQDWLRDLLASARQYPAVVLVCVSAVGAALSAYPVVFGGASYVSADNGAPLLYAHSPFVPGYTSGREFEAKGSDLGAIIWQQVPYARIQREAAGHGELPLWNRYTNLGNPLLGQGQSMLGDPLQALVIATGSSAAAWDAKYILAKVAFALGLGLTVFALTRSLAASALVSLASSFIGFFLFRFNHPAFFSLCYSPWILFAWVRVGLSPDVRATALNAVWIALFSAWVLTSGTVKEAYILTAALNTTGVVLLLGCAKPWRVRVAQFAVALAGLVAFVLITAPLWLVFLHTLHDAYTISFPAVRQLQPSLLIATFDEAFYRLLTPTQNVYDPSLNVLLGLGVIYFLVTLRFFTADRIPLCIAGCAALLMAVVFGVIPPSWIVRVPLIGNVGHLDDCLLCVLIVLGTVLAGIGFARAIQRIKANGAVADLVETGLVLLAIVGAWIGFRQAVHHTVYVKAITVNEPGTSIPVAPFVWWYLLSLLLASTAFTLATWRMLRGAITPARVIVAGLSVVVLVWRFGLHASAIAFPDFVIDPVTRADFAAKSPAVDFLQATTAREPQRVVGIDGNLFPAWTGFYRLESAYSVDALTSPYVHDFIFAVPGWSGKYDFPAPDAVRARRCFDFLNVSLYVGDAADREVFQRAGFQPVFHGDLDVWRSGTAWPRAFFTNATTTYDQVPDLVRRIDSGDGRPFIAVQASDSAAVAALHEELPPVREATAIAATDYKLGANTTAFTVACPGPGVVILNETFWPHDFHATVDGHRARIYRANHVFKAVKIDAAGVHRIEFEYWPKYFYTSLALAGVGVVLLGALLVFGRRRSSPAASTPVVSTADAAG